MSKSIDKTISVKAKGLSDIGRMLEEGYLAHNNEPEEKQKTSFSPSNVGGYHGQCPRYWVRAFNGAVFDEQKDSQGLYNVLNGQASHERIEDLFRKADLLKYAEFEVTYKDPPMHGFVDVMINWEGDSIPGEIKTTRQEAFLVRQATMKPVPQHYVQLLLYLYILKKEKGFLIYENRNDGNFLIIPVVKNEKSRNDLWQVLNWLKEVRKAYEEEHMPKIPYRSNSKVCKTCPLRKECWEDKDNWDIEIAPLEVPKP